MRLTLRTMLAYIDGVLSPADAEELKRKIDANEGASGIMHRIRDVQCRLRLGAPAVEGRGLGADANTVAEYLDNTLAADRIPEFERVCLESDAHLAEAAACHHILSLVLGERAEVDPELRRSLYDLINAPPKVEKQAPPVATPPVAEPPQVAPARTRRKPGVPEYLRDEPAGRGWLKWAVAAAVLLLIGAAAVVAAIGPQELLARLGVQPAEREVAVNDKKVDDENQDQTEDEPGDASTTTTNEATDEAEGDENAADELPADETATTGEEVEADVPFDETDPVENPFFEGNEEAATPAPPLNELLGDEAGDDALDETAPAPPIPDEGMDDETLAGDAETPVLPGDAEMTDDSTDANEGSATGDEPETEVAAAPAANEMGRVFLQDDVLLRYSPTEEVWKRLAQGDIISAGDRLLGFPRFSPAVTLTNGVAVEMMGATQIIFEAPDADGTPGLRIMYGRLVLMPISDPKSPLRLLIGAEEYTVAFPDKQPMLFVEVRPQLVNGENPETTPAKMNVEFYLDRGDVTWQRPGGEPQELKHPLRWVSDPSSPVAVADPPAWIQDEKRTVSESLAAPTIEQNVTANRPVVVSLKEAATHPRHRELRSLAAKCLALVGEYEAFVQVLSDPIQRPAWDGQIEELRASMARSPEDAAKVRLALEKERPGDAKELDRLLWGYSEEQFTQGGAAEDLLNYLEHPDLDFRVLAYWNLRQLTGARYQYEPSEEDGKPRKDKVELWRKKVAQFIKEKQPTQPAP